jgi:DNA-binding LytR/AlgR family response regulator
MEHSTLRFGTAGISPANQVVALTCPTPAAQTATPTAPIRVVLAHRQDLFGQGLAALLAAQPGVDLLAPVADGEAAWEAIRARVPGVALLDLALAALPGIEVARRIRAAALSTRCLALATYPVLASQAYVPARPAVCSTAATSTS